VLGDYPPSTCDFAEPPADVNNALLWVSTFWTDDEEKKALDVLTRHVPPEYNYQPLQMRTRVDSQLSLRAAFDEGRLPDVFQANAGSDVLRWVSKRDPEASAVCELDRLSRTFDWERTYFPESLRPATCHGHLYALPVGIHRLNVLFFNKELFERLAQQARSKGEVLRDPSSLQSPQDLLAELERVAQLGRELELGDDFVPFAIGAQDEWPLTVVAFENVLLGLGKDAYHTLWQGELQVPDDSRQRELVRSLKDMVAYLRSLVELNPMDKNLSWQDALRQVGDGKALFTVTGDWGWAQLDEAQTERVGTVPFPGTSQTFVYTPDSFAVPREDDKSGYRARTFLDSVIADKPTLLEFSKVKHSIPPRRDFATSQLGSASLRESYQQFRDCSDGTSDCEPVLAVSGLSPPPGEDDCFDDIDALLTLAVTGSLPPPNPDTLPRECDAPLPTDREDAEAAMIDLLLRIASQPFAPDCR
jgi:glucose/mannose transport system substrate-binding protein